MLKNATFKKVVLIFLSLALICIGFIVTKGRILFATDEETPTIVANQDIITNKVCKINGEQKRMIQIYLETGIESEEYPIKETTITLDTNIIEGTLEDVQVTSYNKNSYTVGTYEYSNGTLKINLLNENETLTTKEKGLDQFAITYIFSNTEVETIKQPLQKVEIKPYSFSEAITTEIEESNFEYIDSEDEDTQELQNFIVYDEDIHKSTIKEGTVELEQIIGISLPYRKEASNIIIEDMESTFYNNNDVQNSDITLNYKKTSVSKEFLLDALDEEGKLVITDKATNKVLLEYTKQDILALTEDAAIEIKDGEEVIGNLTLKDTYIEINYLVPVTNLKMELTKIKPQEKNQIESSDLTVQNIKTISNITDLENLNNLKQNVKATFGEEEQVKETTIQFKDTVTRANLTVDNTDWVLGETNKVKFTVTLDTTTEKSELFIRPMFLIELPTSVESVNTAKSQFEIINDEGAFYGKRVFITTLLGKKFVVISLEGNQTEETIVNGNTTIELTLELNIAEDAGEGNTNAKLYYQNGIDTTYESGKSFDTAEVTVELVMESEPKDEIGEYNPNEGGETTPSEESDITVTLESVKDSSDGIKEEEQFSYRVCLNNNTAEEKQNLKLSGVIPEGTTLEKIVEYDITTDGTLGEGNELEYKFDETTRKFTVALNSLDKSKDVYIKLKAEKLPEGINYREIKFFVELINENKIIEKTEEVVNGIGYPEVKVEIEKLSETINELGKITLNIKAVNKGAVKSKNNKISIDIPEEITLEDYVITILTKDGEEKQKIEGKLYEKDYKMDYIVIGPGETYNLQLTGKVNYIKADKEITITGKFNEEELTWTTKLVNVTDDDPTNPDNPTNPDDPSKPNDPTNPEDPSKPNDPSNPDDPTKPNDPTNPDKPNDGEEKNEGFDLSLKQYINKITVTNSKGATTYEYKDTNFAKVEIHSKQMNGSTVRLEYKIVVKNEGTIAGYARKIVDYMPQDLIFNSELNSDWYLGDDGNLYSTKFIDKLLKPGETAEIKLILEKKMTNENVGTITNIVEIYEATNDEGVEDINSIPGDKIEGQNDMSKVEVLIVTSTGTIILYTTLAIVVIAILGLGFYKIKKVTKIYTSILFILMLLVITTPNVINAYCVQGNVPNWGSANLKDVSSREVPGEYAGGLPEDFDNDYAKEYIMSTEGYTEGERQEALYALLEDEFGLNDGIDDGSGQELYIKAMEYQNKILAEKGIIMTLTKGEDAITSFNEDNLIYGPIYVQYPYGEIETRRNWGGFYYGFFDEAGNNVSDKVKLCTLENGEYKEVVSTLSTSEKTNGYYKVTSGEYSEAKLYLVVSDRYLTKVQMKACSFQIVKKAIIIRSEGTATVPGGTWYCGRTKPVTKTGSGRSVPPGATQTSSEYVPVTYGDHSMKKMKKGGRLIYVCKLCEGTGAGGCLANPQGRIYCVYVYLYS